MSARKSWKGRLAVALVSPLVLLFVLELVLRLFWAAPEVPTLRFRFANTMDQELGLEGLFQPDEKTFWSLRPGARHPEAKDVITSGGLRGPERPAAKPPGTLRIAVLGDSCTFGIRLADPKTFGRRLEASLEREGARVEVWNGGVPGFTIYQGLVHFRERLRTLQPDVVVLYFGAWNDFNAAFGAGDRERGQGAVQPSATERALAGLMELRCVQLFASRYGKTLRYRHWRRRVDEWLAGEPQDGYRVPLEDFSELAREFLDECEGLGAKAVVVLPELNSTWKDKEPIHFPRLDRYREVLSALAVERGLPTVDLRALFAEGDHAELFRDLVHPSARGHVWLALTLEEELRRSGALPASGDPDVSALRPLAAVREADGRLRLRLEGGPDRAGASFLILGSATPNAFGLAPERPLDEDRVSALLHERYPALTGELDASGAAEVIVDLPELKGQRALGFTARLGAGEDWTDAVWVTP